VGGAFTWWLALAGFSLVLAACGADKKAANADAKASYQVLVGAGTHLLGLGNSHAAEQLFESAIAKDPRTTAAQFDLGVAYQQDGDTRDALRQYVIALRTDPEYVPALYNEATIVAARNAPLAIFYYRQVIRIQPDSPTALLNLGLLESRSRSLRPRALMDLRRAIRLDPSLRARVTTKVMHADVLSAARNPIHHPSRRRSTGAAGR